MTVSNVNNSKIKGLFKTYTGFCYTTFQAILMLLIPTDTPVCDLMKPTKYCRAMKLMSTEDQLLLVMCKLRSAFTFKDLAFRFGISAEAASLLFRNWINFMYFKYLQIPIWPHRDIIIEHMPPAFQKDFPTTIMILDGTELRIQRPSSLPCQSQTYSDYKSGNTLKALIGIDPRAQLFLFRLFSLVPYLISSCVLTVDCLMCWKKW